MGAPSFWAETRAHLAKRPDPLNALVLALPLLAAYELGCLFIDLKNGVDLLSLALVAVREQSRVLYLSVHLAPVVALVVVIVRLRIQKRLRPGLIIPTLVESTVYAVACATLAGWVVTRLSLAAASRGANGAVQLGFFAGIVMSLGAGFWEELVFRGGLFNGLTWLGGKVFGPKSVWALGLSGLLSSLIFSGIHYVGPMGDEFLLVSFVYRFVLGVLFATIFRYRGFAVAAYTHALFDVLVTVIKGVSS
ncbi:MAG: CPBP family intramembrane metalloprotease [Deltaproteobacteria bacterium]|nr:CPBP family intramembrane metalloprotease [Deltaproteobacteria bacterium]